MAIDISKWPLLVLMEHLDEWVSSVNSREFWRALVEHGLEVERLREEAKGIIVWLELKNQDAAAGRLDEAMGELRRSVWSFKEACEGVYPPEEPRCQDAREAMVAAAGRVAGAAEDLHDEVPEEVWEGFFDE